MVSVYFHTFAAASSALPLAAGLPARAVAPSGPQWGCLLAVAATSFWGQVREVRGGGGGGSFLMSEACPGERSYVGLLRVAGDKATRRGGVEPRARARMMSR